MISPRDERIVLATEDLSQEAFVKVMQNWVSVNKHKIEHKTAKQLLK